MSPDWDWVAGHRLAADDGWSGAIKYYGYRVKVLGFLLLPIVYLAVCYVMVRMTVAAARGATIKDIYYYLVVASFVLVHVGVLYYAKWRMEGQGARHVIFSEEVRYHSRWFARDPEWGERTLLEFLRDPFRRSEDWNGEQPPSPVWPQAEDRQQHQPMADQASKQAHLGPRTNVGAGFFR